MKLQEYYNTETHKMVAEFISKSEIRDALDRYDFRFVYRKFNEECTNSTVGCFTEKLLKLGIDPLENTTDVPVCYLYEADIDTYNLHDNIKNIFELAFSHSKITHITLPESLEVIDLRAFESCNRLESVDFSKCKNLKIIGNSAFCATGIVNLDLSNTSVEHIEASAFYLCDELETIKLPSTLKYIDEECFCFCKNLKIVELPEGVEEIGNGAFSCCDKLESIKLPSTLTYISKYSFDNCHSLKEIIAPEHAKILIDKIVLHDVTVTYY